MMKNDAGKDHCDDDDDEHDAHHDDDEMRTVTMARKQTRL